MWDSHVMHEFSDSTALLYIAQHLVHQVTTPQPFDGLRSEGRRVRCLAPTLGVADHDIPTPPGRSDDVEDPEAKLQLSFLRKNTAEFSVTYFGHKDPGQ